DSLAPFEAVPCACARDAAPHNAAIATRNVSIRNTDNWFPHHCDWKMTRRHRAAGGMDSREMLFWEGSCGVAHRCGDASSQVPLANQKRRLGFNPWDGARVAFATAHRSIATDLRRRNCANGRRHPGL